MKKFFTKKVAKALAIVVSASIALSPAVAYAGEEAPAADTQAVEMAAIDKGVAIEDEATAKTAKADTRKASSDWWILVVAAAAGLTIEEYLRRKNIKTDNTLTE